jgi:MFS family permease
MLAGAFGGNITVAQAYIADITPPHERSKKMGLIGMAFGLGFIFGPFIGGQSLHSLGPTGPGWVAAALCAFNFLLALVVLRESRQQNAVQSEPRPHLAQWMHTLRQPRVGLLIATFFATTFCFSCFESTLPLLVGDNFHLDFREDQRSASTVAYLFVYCGLIGALVQGGAIGRLVKRYGESKLIAWSLVLTAISMAVLPFIKGSEEFSWSGLLQPAGRGWMLLLLALGLLSIGSSLTRPPLFGLLSNLTPPDEQGATIGVAQGAGSLARIAGPIFATTLLHYRPALPYLICAGILAAATFVVLQRLVGPSASETAQR